MTEKLFELLSQIISPGKTWGCFFRKTLSTLLVASIGAYSFNAYQRLERSSWEDLPLHTAIAEGDIASEVQRYLDKLIQADDNLDSVWVYSWPDARSLIPTIHAGSHVNPLPLGYFLVDDYKQVGALAMEMCVELNRPLHLVACPVIAENDAWGVVVFNLKGYKANHWRSVYQAFTHKLSNLIYHD